MAAKSKPLIIILLASFSCLALNAKAQSGEILGTIYDKDKQPVVGGIITILSPGFNRYIGTTDIDGNFIAPSLLIDRIYSVDVKCLGYQTTLMTGIPVYERSPTRISIQVYPKNTDKDTVATLKYKRPFIEVGLAQNRDYDFWNRGPDLSVVPLAMHEVEGKKKVLIKPNDIQINKEDLFVPLCKEWLGYINYAHLDKEDIDHMQ